MTPIIPPSALHRIRSFSTQQADGVSPAGRMGLTIQPPNKLIGPHFGSSCSTGMDNMVRPHTPTFAS